MDLTELGDKLKKLRMRKRMSLQELTDDLNKHYPNENGTNFFAKGKLSKWEGGKVDPAMSSLAKVAKYYNVSLDYLTGIEKDNNKFPVVEVPILSRIEKGEEIFTEKNIVGHSYIPDNLKLSSHKLVHVIMHNDAMNQIIQSKEYLLVDMDEDVKDGDIGLFMVSDDTKAVARKVQYFDDQMMLTPLSSNPNYKASLYNKEDVEVLGKIVSTTSFLSDFVI